MYIDSQLFSPCSQEACCFPSELLSTGLVFLWWRLSGVVRLTTGEDETSSGHQPVPGARWGLGCHGRRDATALYLQRSGRLCWNMTLPSTAIVLVPHTLVLWERGAPRGEESGFCFLQCTSSQGYICRRTSTVPLHLACYVLWSPHLSFRPSWSPRRQLIFPGRIFHTRKSDANSIFLPHSL